MVEGSGLENQRARKCSVGSNPTPSAKSNSFEPRRFKRVFLFLAVEQRVGHRGFGRVDRSRRVRFGIVKDQHPVVIQDHFVDERIEELVSCLVALVFLSCKVTKVVFFTCNPLISDNLSVCSCVLPSFLFVCPSIGSQRERRKNSSFAKNSQIVFISRDLHTKKEVRNGLPFPFLKRISEGKKCCILHISESR